MKLNEDWQMRLLSTGIFIMGVVVVIGLLWFLKYTSNL